MITMFLSSVRTGKQTERFVKLRRFKVTILQMTTVIATDSIINGIPEKPRFGKNGDVQVRNIPGVTTEDLQHHLLAILEGNPCRLICPSFNK